MVPNSVPSGWLSTCDVGVGTCNQQCVGSTLIHENSELNVAVRPTERLCYVMQWQWWLVVLAARGVYHVRLTDNCYFTFRSMRHCWPV